MKNSLPDRKKPNAFLLPAFIFLILGFMISGYLYFSYYRKDYESNIERQLSTVSQLKVNELVRWRKERLRDAGFFYENSEFSILINKYFKDPKDKHLENRIRSLMGKIYSAEEYDAIFLLDSLYIQKIVVSHELDQNISYVSQRSRDSLRAGRIIFEDIYYNEQSKKNYLKLLTPVFSGVGKTNIIGIVVLRIDPAKYLYPFIQQWPSDSKSGETLLIRREGMDVLFINQPRFHTDADLKLRFDIEKHKELLAVKAALGQKGIVEGIDYRGVEVMGYIGIVSGSQWFMVSKMDRNEIYSSYNERKWIIGFSILILILSAGASFGFVLKKSNLKNMTIMVESTNKLLESEERFRTIVENTGEGIGFVDSAEKFIFSNRAADEIFGVAPGTLAGMNLRQFTSEPNYAVVKNETLQRINGSKSVYEVEIAQPNGKKRNIIVTAVPRFDSENVFLGTFGVFRDITENKLAEEKLHNKERYQRALLDNFPFAVWLKDTESRFLAVNQVFVKTFGALSVDALIGKSDFDIALPDDAEGYRADDRAVMESRQKKVTEEEIVEHGIRKWFETYKAPVIGNYNELLGTVGFTRDITERKRNEEALRESERFLKETQIIAELGTYTMDIVSGQWKSSEILDAIFGIDAEFDKSVGGWVSIIHPEWQKVMTDYFTDEVIGKKSRFNKEYKIIRRNDHTERWVYGVGELKFNAAHQPITMVGTIKDITERKKAEEILVRERNLLRTLIDNLPDKVHLKNKELQYQLNNIVHLRTLGLRDQTESIGKRIIDFFPLANIQPQVAEEQEIITSGMPKLEYEEQFFDKEKNMYQWYLTSKVPVRDHQDTIVGLLTISRNITESKKTADALRENEQKFRTLFENMTEGVALHEVIYDGEKPIDYRIIDINPAYERHTGLSRIQARGLLASELYGTGTPPYFEEFVSVAKTGTPIMFETFFPPLDRHFHIGVISPGKGLFATVFEDITERKRKEQELREKNSELERFTYTVSHDLKSPLITIKGFSGGLLKDLSVGRTDRFETDLKRIADAANKMNGLLEDLLELSRIGRIINPPSDVALDLLVPEVISLLSGSITKSDAKVIVQDGLPVVRADRRRLFEVIQNLVENALKFTGGHAEPHIEIGMKEENGERVFFVRDNGRGIDPRYLETIFGLFNKLDAKSSGTGIGLALAHRIIEVHGGKIWAESDGPNRGSTFYFTLPLKTKG